MEHLSKLDKLVTPPYLTKMFARKIEISLSQDLLKPTEQIHIDASEKEEEEEARKKNRVQNL